MTTPFRFPDRPGLSHPGSIPDWINASEWCCQAKMDGWRAVVNIASSRMENYFFSIRDRFNEAIVPKNNTFTNLLMDCKKNEIWGGRIDCEYIPSTGEFYVFDVFNINGEDMYNKPLSARWESAVRNFPTCCVSDSNHYHTIFFHNLKTGMKDIGPVEGVVLKRWDSTLIGAHGGSANNPNWIRCRFD